MSPNLHSTNLNNNKQNIESTGKNKVRLTNENSWFFERIIKPSVNTERNVKHSESGAT